MLGKLASSAKLYHISWIFATQGGAAFLSAHRLMILALPVLLTVVLVGCGKSGGVRGSAGALARPVHQAKDAELQASKIRVVTNGVKDMSWQSGGQYIMRAKARELVADEVTGKASLKDGHVILFKHGKQAALLSAKLIEADTRAGALVAMGGITVRSLVANAEVRAQSVTWWRKQNRLLGVGGVSMSSSAGYVLADRVDGETAMQHITLYSDKGGRASLNVSPPERPL
jgi:hypothetical protein